MKSTCVVGDAFIDVLVPIHDIRPKGTYQRDVKISYGGTANVAVWISRFGENAKYFGKVGNDPVGHSFIENLKKEKVNDLISIDRKYGTGVCISLISEGGERTMITDRGANDFITIKDVDTYVGKILDSDIGYFSGYSLLSEPTSKSIVYLMKKASKAIEIWFNPGAPNIITEQFNDLIRKYVDVLVLNLDEAKSLTGKNTIDDVIKELERLSDMTILTMGAKECIVSNNKDSIHIPSIKTSKVVDTTGAGDAFAAGFIAGRIRGLNLEECSRMGHEIASRVIQKVGGR
jgi:sugar/nucleoside kinase (ribokinase family)